MRQYEEENKLLETYAEQVAKFREFCIHNGHNDAFEEVDFSGLSLGFFICLGVTGESGTGEAFYDAFRLASICRYNLQYWDNEWQKP